MQILFCIIEESIAVGDRLLVFSQSLITLDLIEQFLQMNVVPSDTLKWTKNIHYFREFPFCFLGVFNPFVYLIFQFIF